MTVMPMPREKWTDERLDDLNKKVDQGFEKTENAIAETKAEMREGFARMDRDIRDLRGEMNARFQAQNRILISSVVAIIVALIGTHAF